MLIQVIAIHSFSLPSSILLYEYTVPPFIPPFYYGCPLGNFQFLAAINDVPEAFMNLF